MSRTAVVGAGAWGTALAALRARDGERVHLLGRDAAMVAEINRTRRNPRYLPGIELPEALAATVDPAEALGHATTVLLVTPAQTLREVAASLAPHLAPAARLVLCSKGIERATGLFASAVVRDTLPDNPIAVLSGPSFADDVARGLPTAVTLAAEDERLADELAQALSGPSFRVYAHADVLGVEAGGALKNVLALAAGAAAGLGLGASAGAAIVTRGFVELRRLGEALGARPETLMGLSGLGDLVLTCSGTQSRNFRYGLAMGRSEPLDALPLAEGVHSAAIARRLARERGIEAPIIEAVAAILEDRMPVREAVASLLARPLRREFDERRIEPPLPVF
ncbi:NAD(P)H-dependent glycerol-3-phosphate dehydrogenase [Aureimonas jatrophae]|uniref:Glycerol-3-phosphate dehydrogenase [NAD(P)+] n=1 Tax=Aureimonas jatrophae TaxID=1166073 RepID=A0A1H0KWC4_9HYPH|nr:NAD(P)H-dependent glycerol-3-phosphate dehydrogenase [Aureimonas jatrophae]MBB3948903.1 glycerol-3-phosphate dehydrogenase (NAD(P)+) [Aureimonas jatrophae]SDO60073.1 glycerol-3-phosphate dehydrogenase (NAD(P)+) [Aureimonas jatrophae]